MGWQVRCEALSASVLYFFLLFVLMLCEAAREDYLHCGEAGVVFPSDSTSGCVCPLQAA